MPQDLLKRFTDKLQRQIWLFSVWIAFYKGVKAKSLMQSDSIRAKVFLEFFTFYNFSTVLW